MAGFVIEWKYSPSDYFEEPSKINGSSFVATIDGGKIIAETTVRDYEEAKKLRNEITEMLEIRFLAAQVLAHSTYELSHLSLVQVKEDGTKNFFIEPAPGAYILSGGGVDVLVTDKYGNAITDTKRERLDRLRDFVEHAVAHHKGDPLVAAMLKSYGAAVVEPTNELVHLYEIREALNTKYGSESKTRQALNISSKEWSSFGRLCNSDPLLQSRHRGNNIGQLRQATEAELTAARDLARKMIERYIGL